MSPRPRFRAPVRALPPVLLALGLLALAAVAVTGCGDEAGGGPAGGATSATDATDAIVVTDARLDEPVNPSMGAVRLVLENTSGHADRLVGVSSPDADHTSLHRSETDVEGRATMTAVDELEVPAGSRISFGETGLHVMLDGLHREVREGDTVTLSLDFEQAGEVTVEVAVVEPGSNTADAAEHHVDHPDDAHGHESSRGPSVGASA